MNLFRDMRGRILELLQGLAADGTLPAGLETVRVAVEPPRDASHGDMAVNAAMILAKDAGMKPRDLAALLADRIRTLPGVATAEIAGPGFINLRLDRAVWLDCLSAILAEGEGFGRSDMGGRGGRGARVNVEYVSANPTGPLHIGHARGTVFGDVLASLLAAAGYDVCREYYINDAGAQVDILARSAFLRYREALGDDIGAIPEGLYPGDYLKAVGSAIAAEDGARWRDAGEAEWLPAIRSKAVAAMMDLVRADLAALGVRHDVFTSERALVDAGKVGEALAELESRGLIYTGILEPPKGKAPDDWEPRPQTLFRASQFGDDVDRPLKKSDGSWTYFASDIAYHWDKYKRGFAIQIDVWGADHGGYVKRMQAATKAITGGKAALDVKICQIVRIMDQGEPVKMSKRAGTFVTLRDLVDEVGKDVVRFIMLTRKNDAGLDFDLTAVTEQSRDNPVFYVQYAHARCHSVMRMARTAMPGLDISPESLRAANFARLTDESELGLIRAMGNWPRTVESAAEAHEPHRLAFYMYDLASEFHALWTKGKEDATLRFIIEDDPELTTARLALVRGVQTVIAAGLGIFGVHPVEELR
ncbi:MAG: arginine--tRNA ligase [Alphaproteobacteria bacterium]|nr:arginine--tRNA ligase [Alphaproteobacteria bacterium]